MILHDLSQELFLFVLMHQDSIEPLNQDLPSLSCIVNDFQPSYFLLALNVIIVSGPCICTSREDLLWYNKAVKSCLVLCYTKSDNCFWGAAGLKAMCWGWSVVFLSTLSPWLTSSQVTLRVQSQKMPNRPGFHLSTTGVQRMTLLQP